MPCCWWLLRAPANLAAGDGRRTTGAIRLERRGRQRHRRRHRERGHDRRGNDRRQRRAPGALALRERRARQPARAEALAAAVRAPREGHRERQARGERLQQVAAAGRVEDRRAPTLGRATELRGPMAGRAVDVPTPALLPAAASGGTAWPTADPAVAGPFAVVADKNVGPLAGVVPDPVYGNTQQHFNVYRPKDLAQGNYCHPILVWANGHTDNPEPNPPDCQSSKYCGSYLMLMNQLASHGFVVIASLSTITSQGNPLPTIVGLDWLIQQADDSTSPYYHRLDTAHIGALGHSEGGLSTSKASSDPRITAVATVSGSAVNAGIHGPSLWFCGGKDTVVSCDSVKKTYASITTQPAMFVDNLAADHGGWLYQSGIKGPDIFGLTGWFRVQLMGDTANRKMFYGADCTLCKDSRLQVEQNPLMTQ